MQTSEEHATDRGPRAPDGGPAGGDPAEQAAGLVRARRRATGLLVAVACAWLAALLLPDGTAVGYLRAALEAGLVGGLADWFAVVALFRHPLGIPIPHTAVVPRSKDGLGQNLGTFVRDNFLEEGRVAARLADPARLERLGAWLEEPANARRVAVECLRVTAAVAHAVDREDLVPPVAAALRRRLGALPVARLTGEAVEHALARRAHVEVVTAVLEGLLGTLAGNRQVLRTELGRRSPTWVPPVLDDIVFDQADQVVRSFLRELARTPDHPLRAALDEQLLELTHRLQTEEALAGRVDEAVQEVVTEELVQRWVDAAWDEVLDTLDAAAASDAPDGGVLALATRSLVHLGEGLGADGVYHARAVGLLEAAAPHLAAVGQQEVVGLVGQSVAAWDGEETADRLELWLGRDLQFVRVNGTLVGALVGLVLHAVTQLL